MTMIRKPVLVALIWGLSVAILGGWATNLDAWYHALKEPFWKPPDWLFGPIWSAIFILSGTAWVIAWDRNPAPTAVRHLTLLFVLNGLCNLIWSFLYFRLERPDWALYESSFLWLSVFAILYATRHYSPKSSLLMLPYLIWVSIAIVLNWDTVRLNGPFG